MAEFFRFRSMEHLLGKHQELEKQTIHFATPEQLNDPMEGFRDIVWSGDKIVWTNLFKNYVYRLHRNYYLFKTEGGSIQLGSLPILGRWDELPPFQKKVFDDIWDRFRNLPNIQQIIETLADTKRKIRYEEFGYYLIAIHLILSVEIPKSYLEYGLIHKSQMPRLPRLFKEVSVSELLKSVLHLIERAGKAESEKQFYAMFSEVEKHDNNIRIINLYNRREMFTEISGKNNQLMMFDFPKVYLKDLEKLLWSKWYTACFTKSYHNSSVWGHYGDSHKGACLIFEAVETDELNNLELNPMIGEEPEIMPFREVSYQNKTGEVDFFRSIGMVLRLSALMKLWYTDQDGNISECADAWPENYSDIFYRDITTKTEDWEYEQEYRLILDNGNELDDPKNRTLTYNFNSLKGIIFGINTSDEDKLRIMDIIEDKCKENNRTDFQLFQAFYSPRDGKIHKHEIQLSF